MISGFEWPFVIGPKLVDHPNSQIKSNGKRVFVTSVSDPLGIGHQSGPIDFDLLPSNAWKRVTCPLTALERRRK